MSDSPWQYINAAAAGRPSPLDWKEGDPLPSSPWPLIRAAERADRCGHPQGVNPHKPRKDTPPSSE